MVNANEIKTRIGGIADTKKITDAMYKISSAKMRRALRDLDQTAPYFESLTQKIGELFHYIPKTKSRYFRVPDPTDSPHRNHGILLITSDRGLAGVYNQAAIGVCEEYMHRHPKTTLFIIGEYGRQYFENKKIEYVKDFLYSASQPRLLDARKICMDLLEYYDSERLDEINIIYTDYIGAKPGECKKITLLPLERTKFLHDENIGSYVKKELIPNPNTVLDGVVPSYIMGFIYSSLVESFCSEQQARMTAMKHASDNAEEMLRTLKIEYNKIRQAAITDEMTEITAGVRAQKRKSLNSITGEDSNER